MNLGLEVARSRAAPIDVEVVRPLGAEDLNALLLGEKEAKARSIVKLRTRHHALARALAGGLSTSEAAVACGFGVATVSILLDDPTFKELIAHYSSEVHEKFLGMQEKLAGLGEDVVDELAERLASKPGEFSNDELTSLLKTAADRSGFGPSSSQNVNVNIGIADRLAEARKRLSEARGAKIIEHEPE